MSYQASKWLKIHMLISPGELLSLGERCAPFSLFPLGRVLGAEELPGSIHKFIDRYRGALELSSSPHDLASAWSLDPAALEVRTVAKGSIVKIISPVMQVRPHFVRYSEADRTLRSMAWGPDALFWGLEFSYPQLYQEPSNQEIVSALDLPNARLFKRVRQWIRDETIPTTFSIEGEKMVMPIRMGRQCESWAKQTPSFARWL